MDIPRGTPDPCGGMDSTLYATVVYGGSKLINSFVLLGSTEQGIDASGVGVAGLATIALI